MPKIYSDFEKQYIRKRLKEEAANCMSLYGIKKTTVDELVKRVKIPKGTFYLFYENKEVLFFEVLNELHTAVEDKFKATVQEYKGSVSVDCLTEWILQLFLDTNNLSMLRVMETGDWELLMRRLPQEVIIEHARHDNDLILMVAQAIPMAAKKDLEVFATALRAVFIMLVYQKEIAAKDFASVLRLTIRGIVLQLFEVNKNNL